jgi:hypothetical protein
VNSAGELSHFRAHPGRLWSLWDIMINFDLSLICRLIREISLEEERAHEAILKAKSDTFTNSLSSESSFKKQIKDIIDNNTVIEGTDIAVRVSDYASLFELNALLDRADRTKSYIYIGMQYSEYYHLIKILRETIEDEFRRVYFHQYDAKKVGCLLDVHIDWPIVMTKFPSATNDILSAVDCYAIDQNTACVFHLMRVAERGLRALANERKIPWPKHPVEWATWQDILMEIEKSTKPIGAWPRGPKKDAALAFYSGAIGQLHAFKELYRNAVMHVRADYDEHDAARAINQVCDFMTGLSSKIGEKTSGPIKKCP